MSRRERILATTLIVLLVVVGGGFAFHLFVYEPISEVREQLRLAEESRNKRQAELAEEQSQIESLLRVNPRLSQWQKISLPPRDPESKKLGVPLEEQKRKHIAQMQVEYERYLSELLRSSGFRSDSIVIAPRQPDRRSTLVVPKGKEPLYERLAFGVNAKGSKDNIVRALREFHKTPLLHQVRTINVGTATGGSSSSRRGSESQLEVNLVVEALMVAGAEERTALLPGKLAYPPRVLAEPGRDYARMEKRNMFTGVTPPPAPPPSVERPTRVTEDRADVLRFIKLTSLFYNPERRRWEASLYDQATGPRRIDEEDEDGNRTVKVIWERQLNTRILSELAVQDRYRNTILDAKVVHIDEDQLIFKADKQFFRLRCGDTLYPAIEKPLTSSEVRELGLGE